MKIGRRMCDFFTTILVAGIVYSGCLTPDDAFAQWQVPQYQVPIGRGAGVVGFSSGHVSYGPSTYPSLTGFNVQPITNTNNGITLSQGTGPGSSGGSIIIYAQNGTTGAPTTVITGQELGSISTYGYDGTDFGVLAGNPTSIVFTAIENWTASAHGQGVGFQAMPIGTVAALNEGCIVNGLTMYAVSPVATCVGQGLGPGTVNAIGGLYDNSNRAISASNTLLSITQNTSTVLQVSNASTGTAALSGLFVSNSANSGTFGLGGTGYTGFSSLLQNKIFAYSSASAGGIAFYADGASHPITGITNGTEVFRALLGFMVGTTTDPGAGLINVATGFRIANAATSGNVLRGNGTNFVSSALAFSDLSGQATLAQFPSIAANTVLANATSGSAIPTAFAVSSCSAATNALIWTTNTGFGCNSSINAATLGGATFAAPGAIGGGTPSTGAFTTLTASTSISSPIHASSGKHTFQSNGSTFAGAISTGQLWYLGTTDNAPQTSTLLTVSTNTAAPAVAFTLTNAPQVQIVAADTARPMLAFRGFGTNPGTLAYTYARGTAASPTATQTNDALGLFVAYGYQTTTSAYNSGGAGFQMVATENHTSTANGTELQAYTVPNTTAATTLAGKWFASGGFGIGSTLTDPLAGGLYVQGATITFNGLATDATHTTRTVCQDTTSKSLFFGSGAVGICLGTSSARYKRDIEPLHDGLAEIVRLVPKTFIYRAGYGDDGAKRHPGFMAEDVFDVMPSIVGLDDKGRPNSVDWAALTPVMINAISELKADNDNIRSELKRMTR